MPSVIEKENALGLLTKDGGVVLSPFPPKTLRLAVPSEMVPASKLPGKSTTNNALFVKKLLRRPYSLQSLVQIGDDIFHCFDPRAQPHESIMDAHALAL